MNQALTIAALLRLGRRDEARARYEALAVHDFADVERDEHWLVFVDVVADLVLDFEDRRRGAILYEMLLPYRALLISHDLLRVVTETAEGVLGMLALLAGRTGDAIAHYERALERAAQLALAPALGLARVGLARALLARGARGDFARVRELLAEVAASPPSAAQRAAESLSIPRGSARRPNLKKSSSRPRDPRRAR